MERGVESTINTALTSVYQTDISEGQRVNIIDRSDYKQYSGCTKRMSVSRVYTVSRTSPAVTEEIGCNYDQIIYLGLI